MKICWGIYSTESLQHFFFFFCAIMAIGLVAVVDGNKF
jgi:hypothetical protein